MACEVWHVACDFECLQLRKARGERSSFVLALEELKEAEQKGYVRFVSSCCLALPTTATSRRHPPLPFPFSFLLRDDSLDGLRFYPNIWA